MCSTYWHIYLNVALSSVDRSGCSLNIYHRKGVPNFSLLSEESFAVSLSGPWFTFNLLYVTCAWVWAGNEITILEWPNWMAENSLQNITWIIERKNVYKNVQFSTKQCSVTPGQTVFNENKKRLTALCVTLEIKSSDVLLLLYTLHISGRKIH